MKRLYKIHVEYDFVVVADNEAQAIAAANRYAPDVAGDQEPDHLWTDELNSIDDVPKSWRDCYPYGKDDTDRTCAEIMLAQSAKT